MSIYFLLHVISMKIAVLGYAGRGKTRELVDNIKETGGGG